MPGIINKNLEKQSRLIFESWFILHEPFNKKDLSEFKTIQLKDIATIKTKSFNPNKNSNILVEHYSIPAFDSGKQPVFEYSKSIKSNKYSIDFNNILISKLNPDTKRVWRPNCCTNNAICSTEFIVLESKNNFEKDFLYAIVDSKAFNDWMCSIATGSTNSRQRAKPQKALEFEFLCPPDKFAQKFAQIVTPLYDLIEINILEIQKLKIVRNALLPKLLMGEIDI